uniref:P2X purinoreceptor 7 intracellular domain-containing protein n=1 Tax=Amphimedon queenslandica TaxID=400682 RepID=A0A1X7TPZ2_AMPQE
MNTPAEDVCCGRLSCITNYGHFYNICLDQQVLTVAIHQRSDIRADPMNYSSESFRKSAYRQNILWKYKKLGRGNRRVCPSCVVLAIRH